VLNGGESDLDCGGTCPEGCLDGQSCQAPQDCQSGVCTGNVCLGDTCSDGVKNGSEVGLDCGGSCAPCPTLVFVATSATQTELGWLAPGGSPVLLNSPSGSLCDPSVVLPAGSTKGMATICLAESGPGQNDIKVATWTDAAQWSALGDLPVPSKATDKVFLSPLPPETHASYRGADGNHYYAVHDGAAWVQTAIPMGSGGPASPAILALPGKVEVVFFYGLMNNGSSTQETGDPMMSWGEPIPTPLLTLNNTTATYGIHPRQDPPYDAELCIVGATSLVSCWWRDGSYWDQTVSPTLSPAPDTSRKIALAPLSNKRTLLVYADANNNLHYALRGTDGFWVASAPVGVESISAPSVAPGIGGADAELGYVAPGGIARHIRLIGGSWQEITDLTAGVDRIAIAAR
jgi:hypothetical protein